MLLSAGAAVLQGQSAPADLREAARLDREGKCRESEALYQRALTQGSGGVALWNNTGNHYLACKQPEKAREYFARVLKASPGHFNAGLQMAQLEIAAGAFNRAVTLLKPLAAARPEEFGIQFLLGRAMARGGEVKQAREVLEAALRLRPADPAVMLEAGLANAASGNYPRAVFLLARARQHAPRQPGIALALARAAEDAGYYGDAVEAYEAYLKLQPNDVTARRDQARARALTGSSQGVRDLRAYVQLYPQDALGHFYLAQLTWREEPEAALALLSQAIERDSELVSARVAKAWLLHRLGRPEEALEAVEAALRIAPHDVRALDQRGVTLLALDRATEAEKALRQAASLAPRDADVALHLGRALVDQGRDDEGQQHLERWKQLRPERQRSARREAGMIELAMLDPAGRREREIERFRAMAKSRPDDPLLQLNLAGLLLDDGQVSEAVAAYQVLAGLNGDKKIWHQAGRTLLDAGLYREAMPFLDRAGDRLAWSEASVRSGGDASGVAVAQLLEEAVAAGTPKAQAARSAGLLLAWQGSFREALTALAEGRKAHAGDRDLQLVEAAVLALAGSVQQARAKARQLQSRWPDWENARVFHALVQNEANLGKCGKLWEWLFQSCKGRSPRGANAIDLGHGLGSAR